MPRKLKGIRPWKGGLQARIKVNGRTYAKTFPLSTDLQVLRDWRDRTKNKFSVTKATTGSFGADIVEYLTRVSAMPTYKQVGAHLELWAVALGRERTSASITATDIDEVMQEWLSGGLGPATVKKRRATLRAMFNRLHGKQAENPVRGSRCPVEPKAEARGCDFSAALRVVAAMPDYLSAGPGKVRHLALGKLRAAVMLTTGMPPIIIKQIRATDLDLDAPVPEVHVARRLKGRGVEAKRLKLNPHAVAAFRAFAAAKAFGNYAEGAVNVAIKRAAKRAGVSDFHQYDLRHAFATEFYRRTRDLATVSRALLHAERSTVARRYTLAAHEEVDAAAALTMGQAFDAAAIPAVQQRPPRKTVRQRKSNKNRPLRIVV